MIFYSPLRYPGGKNKLAAFIAKICIDNNIKGHYVEPYAGGASVALFLLMEGFVKRITINDKDRSIYAFWHSVLHKSKQLCELIENTDLSIEEWRKQKEVQKNKEKADLLELGFSTLFLNRTNRSGIISAGVIGGLKQDGDYLLDCRFNKQEIIERIKAIANKKKFIRLYKKDAIKLIDKIQSESENSDTIFYFDPPYFLKGSSLYMNHYKNNDHELVSNKIKEIRHIRWIVSYDNVPEIKGLYSSFYKKEYLFQHTAYNVRLGQEILFFSKSLNCPDFQDWNPLAFKLKKKGDEKTIQYIN